MAIGYGTYSFFDVQAAISGPGGSFGLKGGNAAEGITIARVEDKDTMTIGADGHVMHSHHVARACTVTIRLLKTSPVNAQLRELYNYQDVGSVNWGKNVITIRNIMTGDEEVISGAAFAGLPENSWATEGNTLEWVLNGAIQSGKTGPLTVV